MCTSSFVSIIRSISNVLPGFLHTEEPSNLLPQGLQGSIDHLEVQSHEHINRYDV